MELIQKLELPVLWVTRDLDAARGTYKMKPNIGRL